MTELQELVSGAIDYRITWCEMHRAKPYNCDWRIDPCLVAIYSCEKPYYLFLQQESANSAKGNNASHCVVAQKGQALLIPAGTPHRLEAPACEIRGINIEFTLFGGIDVLSFYQTPPLICGADAQRIKHSIEQLVAVIGRRSRLYPIETSEPKKSLDIGAIAREHQLAFELLSHVLECSELVPKGEQRILVMQKLQPALHLIEERLHKKLSIALLASSCNLSQHRFSTLFKETLGDSPHQFVVKRRLQQAMSLLANSNTSVADIAETLGFHDQPHFTKLFKSHTGLSPAFYRKDVQRRVAAD